MDNKKTWIKSILIPVILGGIVALVISRFMDYNTLNKPTLSPPGYIFGIVWDYSIYFNGSVFWNFKY